MLISCINYLKVTNNFEGVLLRIIQGLIQDLNLGGEGVDQVHRYKDCPNCIISAPSVVGAKVNL